jgi:hypothetical protein
VEVGVEVEAEVERDSGATCAGTPFPIYVQCRRGWSSRVNHMWDYPDEDVLSRTVAWA